MDLLQALYKERRTLEDRINIITLFLSNGSPVVTTTPYTEEDLGTHQQRLDEVKACIGTIKDMRKNNIANYKNAPSGDGV